MAYLADRVGRVRDIQRQHDAWKRLCPHFGALRPDQVSRDACREYTAARTKAGVTAGTIARELSTLAAGLHWGGHAPVIEKPSSGKVDPRHLTRAEFARLWAVSMPPHLRVYLAVAITTGARSQAILELTWLQVDLERRQIDLGTGWGNKKRAITPISDSALPVLVEAKARARTPYVVEYADRPVGSIRTGLDGALRRAGLPMGGPRMLRHTAAVWMAQAGVPMAEIAEHLGHTNTALTARHYARFGPDHLQRGAKALNW